ncbi:penicillin-binding protein 2 [Labilibaculum sp. A4]|uniref:penicillin-binding protein 2 n=1 Tax=Labilibaculum euxinus TaxID=2686357 RepID=UPI000F624B59|nr:penicillin-binding protein 2 [Labilibaculum euxinus]MDQ1769900.1 penicillin-binding protein 2 [Labilibaculum euxinus]MWN76455.1 penicillin-binding protein 2 [Labilibaculum euxinus]
MNNFSNRKYIIGGIFILVVLIFIIRLFNLQIIDDTYKLSAENNSQRQVTQYPARGLIYDRNGKLLVYNQAAYDLMLIPRQLEVFDTTDFCQLLGIEKLELIEGIAKAKHYSYRKASIFLKQLSSERYAVLQEKLYKFPGFFVQTRTLRKYPFKSAAHALGYLREVTNQEIKSDPYFRQGDYIGKSGIERTYEKELRGEKGVKIYWVDVFNRIKGSFRNGKFDEKAVSGKNLHTSLDIDLQQYGELLMQNKKGGIVAIEPHTGEILAKVSSPGYDPEMFVGRAMNKNYQMMVQNDSLKPLFDRTMQALYPPGSIFKLVNALVALQENVISPATRFECHSGYHVGNFTMGCHSHASPLDLRHAIQQSCNAYFANVFRYVLESPKFGSVQDGYTAWRKHVTSFGFGSELGIDLPNEKTGSIPTNEYYQTKYRKNWRALNAISLAIGQGELQITPMQMANMIAAIANRGYYYIPHIVKAVGEDGALGKKYLEKHYTSVDSSNFTPVIDGMEMVVTGGEGSTGALAAIKDIRVCGKTGTVQNSDEADHSVFVAFAPRENPKIAIVVYVENGVWGSRYAAPISGLMIEKYLKGEISENKKWLEKRMLDADLINQAAAPSAGVVE